MTRALKAVGSFLSVAWGATADYINSFDPGLVRAILLKVARHFLTASGPLVAAYGHLSQSSLAEYTGSAEFVVGLVLSIWDAYTVKRKIANAVVVGRAEMGKTTEKNQAVEALKTEVKA